MLRPDDLSSLLDELASPADDVWHASPLPGAKHVFVGRGPGGVVGILVEQGAFAATGRPTVLRHIRFVPSFDATIRQGDTQRTGSFSALWCENGDSTLTDYFLRVVCNLVLSADVLAEKASPTVAIGAVLELFAALGQAPRKSLQGLWGEVYLLMRATDASAALLAWHTAPGELFDFVGPGACVEVKTSTTGLREHVFKLDQLLAPEGSTVHVASLLLQDRSDGQTLLELVDAIRARPGVTGELRRRLDVVVASTLGTGWREATDRRLAVVEGDAALAVYRAEDIPRVNSTLPAEVSDVTFRSDLTSAPRLKTNEIEGVAGLLGNLTSWARVA